MAVLVHFVVVAVLLVENVLICHFKCRVMKMILSSAQKNNIYQINLSPAIGKNLNQPYRLFYFLRTINKKEKYIK